MSYSCVHLMNHICNIRLLPFKWQAKIKSSHWSFNYSSDSASEWLTRPLNSADQTAFPQNTTRCHFIVTMFCIQIGKCIRWWCQKVSSIVKQFAVAFIQTVLHPAIQYYGLQILSDMLLYGVATVYSSNLLEACTHESVCGTLLFATILMNGLTLWNQKIRAVVR